MFYRFKHFHPLKGLPPKALHFHGADIVMRGRELLKNRKLSEIKAAVNIVNWMIESADVRDKIFRNLEELAKRVDSQVADTKKVDVKEVKQPASKCADQFGPLTRNNDSSIFALLLCKARHNISGYDDFPNATWHELFAVLALGLIEKACDDEKYYGSWPHDQLLDWLHEWRIETHVSNWMIEAMDAVATAEGLAREIAIANQTREQTLDDTKKKLSLRNKAAAIQRHAKTTDAVLTLFDLYRAGNFKSYRNAAQTFADKFPDKVAHLAPTNRVRTLSEGLSKQQQKKTVDSSRP
ncbi:MAG: hypothetical protein Q8N54_09565 [Sulfurimicrobium sp.]|nr:hypothetical protein [Sulfurimicrobium sp.]